MIHAGQPVAIGLDLSQTRDITAMAVVTRTGEVTVDAVDKDGDPVKLIPSHL